jgi:hypothetical protein
MSASEAPVIYAEYIEHDRFLPIQIFQHIGRQAGWSSTEDAKIANLGRAERLAPGPSVICLWRHRGLARMDEWEASFRTAEAIRDPAFQATRLGLHFVEAGLYDEVVGGPALGDGLHVVEFFAPDATFSDAAIGDHFRARAGRHDAAKLDFVLRRVGTVGPDPGGLALWTCAGYAAAEPLLRERHDHALAPLRTGLYWNFDDALI